MESRATPVVFRLRKRLEEANQKRRAEAMTLATLQHQYAERTRKDDEAYYEYHRTLPVDIQTSRERAYALYKDSTPNPHPISRFKWVSCLLCRNTIVDDPYGQNPFPLCEMDDNQSRACKSCNDAFVLPARLRCIEADIKTPLEALAFLADYKEEVYKILWKGGGFK